MNINEFIQANYGDMTDQEMSPLLGISPKAVKNRRHRMNLMKGTVGDKSFQDGGTQSAVDEIDALLKEVGNIEKATLTKYVSEKEDNDGVIKTTTNYTTRINVDTSTGPDWTPITQAPPINITPTNVSATDRDMKVAVILPDPQIGFRFDPHTKTFDPFHDETAMNVALQIVQELQPDKVVNLGDFLDLPQYSRFAQEPFFAHTTQPAIDRASSFLGEQRASAPNAEIVLIQGNHDLRLEKFMQTNAMAAWGLKRANADKHEPPVMSIPFLLRLEDIGVEYIEGYPSGEYYINDHLKCIHGKRTGRRGRIAPTIIDDERVSTITGHNHHIEIAFKTIHKRDGLFMPFAAILGCLCRIDGAVPSVHSGLNSNGKPIRNYEDWQQAVGVVYYREDDPNPQIDAIKIREGRAIFQGREYTANI